jgi:type III secretory pathway component EscR
MAALASFDKAMSQREDLEKSSVMISLPIKILLFVLADGWVLLMRGLVTSFTP